MVELKPCPFCGGTSLKIESKHNGTHYWTGTHSATVRCNKCHARGGTASCKVERGSHCADEITMEKAIEAWNKRVPQTTVNQFGENCTNISNCGTLNLNL